MKNLSISILNLDDIPTFLKKLDSIQHSLNESKVEDKFNITIHFDVMDNKFVPNRGIDIEKIKIVREYGYYVDTHLMVEKPIEDGYIDRTIEYGCQDITIHYEIDDFDKNLNYLLKKKDELNGELKIGVSIKPNTDISVLKKYVGKIDKILIMSVEPGFGGQSYIESSTEKIGRVKTEYENIFVQVDGGINSQTLSKALNVDSLVVGS